MSKINDGIKVIEWGTGAETIKTIEHLKYVTEFEEMTVCPKASDSEFLIAYGKEKYLEISGGETPFVSGPWEVMEFSPKRIKLRRPRGFAANAQFEEEVRAYFESKRKPKNN